jgi:hypothetical protein
MDVVERYDKWSLGGESTEKEGYAIKETETGLHGIWQDGIVCRGRANMNAWVDLAKRE